jgi:hypothetical protein
MPAERTPMRHVREVLRLKFVGGVPTREIAVGLEWRGEVVCEHPSRAQAQARDAVDHTGYPTQLWPSVDFSPAERLQMASTGAASVEGHKRPMPRSPFRAFCLQLCHFGAGQLSTATGIAAVPFHLLL